MSPRTLDQTEYENAQLREMREWVAGGMGAEVLREQTDKWAEEKGFMNGLAIAVREKMNSAGVSIQGQAGDAMQSSVSPVVLWTEVTSASADAQSLRTTDQADAFSKVQSSIPKQSEDTPVPEENWMGKTWAAVTGGKTDNEEALEANEKLRQEAVTAFNGYHSASQGAVGASAVFEAPPERGMQTSVSSTPQQSIGQHDMSVSNTPANTSSAWAGSGNAGVPGGGMTTPAPDAGARPPAGSNPVWSQPGTGTVPGRPGSGPSLPGAGGPGKTAFKGDLLAGGPGAGGGAGTGGGAGAGRGAVGGAGGGARGAMGPGGSAGGGSAAGGRPGAGAGAAGAGGAGGARGGAMGGGMGGGGRGQGQQGEEDAEHQSPDYLKGDQGIFDDDIPAVAPAVLGDWSNQQR